MLSRSAGTVLSIALVFAAKTQVAPECYSWSLPNAVDRPDTLATIVLSDSILQPGSWKHAIVRGPRTAANTQPALAVTDSRFRLDILEEPVHDRRLPADPNRSRSKWNTHLDIRRGRPRFGRNTTRISKDRTGPGGNKAVSRMIRCM